MQQSARFVSLLCALSIWVLSSSPAAAQTAPPAQVCSAPGKLGCLVPALYGNTGLVLPQQFHSAHFLSDFQGNFRPLNAAMATELTRLPLASPASGFTYAFNSATGVFTRSAQSFGPVLTERAETIGRGKFYLGFAYQRFNFDSIDGIDLDNLPVVFQHERQTGAAYEQDFITTRNSVDMHVNQFTIFGTVGLTDRIDLALAVPILDVSMKVASTATIHRIAPPSPQFGQAHFFNAADPNGSTTALFQDSGSASGIGDVTLRLKGTVMRWESSSLALAVDIRAPSGEAKDFLGGGAWGVRPFLAYSIGVGRFAPHFNAGYEINGNSVLAGDVSTGRKAHLPNSFSYAVGTDIGVARPLTLAFDLMGQRIFNSARVYDWSFTSPAPELANPSAGAVRYANTRFATGSFNMTGASAGLKYNLFDRLLVSGNLLFRLDDGGLKAKVVPLIGVSYTFR